MFQAIPIPLVSYPLTIQRVGGGQVRGSATAGAGEPPRGPRTRGRLKTPRRTRPAAVTMAGSGSCTRSYRYITRFDDTNIIKTFSIGTVTPQQGT